MRWRCWVIRITFVLAFFALIANIYKIQILKGDEYAVKANAQEKSYASARLDRGLIYFTDKNNNSIEAVLNKKYLLVYAVPTEIKDPHSVALLLSDIIGKDVSILEKMLSKKGDQYELLIEKASAEQERKIKDLNITGIHYRDNLSRFYNFKNMASHLLGIYSPSEDNTTQGRYGLELFFEDYLIGSGTNEQKKDFQQGDGQDSLYLTIDRNIQSEAERIIASLMKEWKADSATAIVQDPFTGKILAMASLPDFDPNDYSKYKIQDFLNPAVESVYEPGSVFKPLTMSAGIDSGKITPQTTYNDVGFLKLDGATLKNWDNKAHGLQTMTNVIEKSLNTGAAFAEKTMGHKIFAEYIKKFGFGEKTNITLPGEVNGSIRNLSSKKNVDFATMSYGQGISVTPIQMINAFSAIANGGVLLKPLIVQGQKPEVIRRVISKETSQKVIDMMVSAVDKNILASVDQYNVAGKTGTAFIPNFGGKGYSENVINTYLGFAPATNPKFVVYIKLDNPIGTPLAGQTVVPAFKSLTEYLLNYYEIKPDRQN